MYLIVLRSFVSRDLKYIHLYPLHNEIYNKRYNKIILMKDTIKYF